MTLKGSRINFNGKILNHQSRTLTNTIKVSIKPQCILFIPLHQCILSFWVSLFPSFHPSSLGKASWNMRKGNISGFAWCASRCKSGCFYALATSKMKMASGFSNIFIKHWSNLTSFLPVLKWWQKARKVQGPFQKGLWNVIL